MEQKLSRSAKSNSAVHFADRANGRVAYLDQGPRNGRAILLRHGFSGDRTTWSGIASGLRRANYCIIVPDLPAHGQTTIDANNADELSTFLPAFLDVLEIAEVDIVAHSLGAVAATQFATAHADRVSSLTLIASTGLDSEVDTGFIFGMANATTAGEVSHLLRRIAAKPVELSPELAAEFAKTMAKGRLKTLSAAIIGPSGQTTDNEVGISDVLVNNAGIVRNGPASETSGVDWRAVIDVNLNGVFYCAQAFGKRMAAVGRGATVNISSMCGEIVVYPQPQVAYNAAKAGVTLITKSLAVEWAKQGVRVNAVAPGCTATELTLAGRSNEEWFSTWMR